jgi:hypothetical protein
MIEPQEHADPKGWAVIVHRPRRQIDLYRYWTFSAACAYAAGVQLYYGLVATVVEVAA